MIKTIVFNGGLGNQMFQYAFYLRVKQKYPLSVFCFDVTHAADCHCGYELDEVFYIDSYKKARRYRRIERHWPELLDMFFNVRQKNSLEYDPSIISSHGLLLNYQGFWQSEKYFFSIKEKVRKAFSFRTERLNEKTKSFLLLLHESNAVSVHVRRGDYVLESEQRGLCSMSYYEKAMSFIKERVEKPLFVFFSDDVDWVKDSIKCDNSVYVTWNHGNDSWQDMYLMSQCKHNIIANSSFSWWGAWLNSNQDKIVVTPTPWFNNSLDYDIIPSTWVKIER